MITLTKNERIGEGRERVVYKHPNDRRLCIKIAKNTKPRHKRAMLREVSYLKRHQAHLPYVSRYHETVTTSLGKGYVFDLVLDYDGAISKTLKEYIASHSLSDLKDLDEYLTRMQAQFLDRNAVVHDLKPQNVMVQWEDDKNYRLVLVDGFGNSDFVKICDYSKRFAQAKLDRKFTLLKKILFSP